MCTGWLFPARRLQPPHFRIARGHQRTGGGQLRKTPEAPDGPTVEIAGVEAPQQCKDLVKSFKPGGLGGHGGSSCSTIR